MSIPIKIDRSRTPEEHGIMHIYLPCSRCRGAAEGEQNHFRFCPDLTNRHAIV